MSGRDDLIEMDAALQLFKNEPWHYLQRVVCCENDVFIGQKNTDESKTPSDTSQKQSSTCFIFWKRTLLTIRQTHHHSISTKRIVALMWQKTLLSVGARYCCIKSKTNALMRCGGCRKRLETHSARQTDKGACEKPAMGRCCLFETR